VLGSTTRAAVEPGPPARITGRLVLARPIIGVTTAIEQDARWRVWNEPAALLSARYLDAIACAGGRAVLLPPDEGSAEETLAVLDGLVVSGGSDISPSMYGSRPHPKTTGVRPERDHSELALVETALKLSRPVLGICRGAQLISVAHGGALHQHLSDVVGHDRHRPALGRYGYHDVRIHQGSRLGHLLGDKSRVASYHHQGIAAVGVGLEAVAWSDDGSIEAVESSDPGRFVLGVLWHPERDDDGRLFAALTEAAKG
jgi:putative glutamine amidotransferase